MKKILLGIAVLVVIGCDNHARLISEKCYKGVTIWYGYQVMTIALDTNSKIIPCKED